MAGADRATRGGAERSADHDGREDSATVGTILRHHGYGTSWFGKNHNTPEFVASQAGPFDQWPLGMGVVDVLPNVDLDLMAGGMFRDQQQLGPFTSTSIESYWIGLGLTWHCGGGCRRADGGCASETIRVEPY